MLFEVLFLTTIQSVAPPMTGSPLPLPTKDQDPKTLLVFRGSENLRDELNMREAQTPPTAQALKTIEIRAAEKLLHLDYPLTSIELDDRVIKTYLRDLNEQKLLTLATHLKQVAHEDIEVLAMHAAERIRQQAPANIRWKDFQNNFYPLLIPFDQFHSNYSMIAENTKLRTAANSMRDLSMYYLLDGGSILLLIYSLLPLQPDPSVPHLPVIASGILQGIRWMTRLINDDDFKIKKAFGYQHDLEDLFFETLKKQLVRLTIPENKKERHRWFEAAMNGELELYESSKTKEKTLLAITRLLEQLEVAMSHLPRYREGLAAESHLTIERIERIYEATKKDFSSPSLWRQKKREDIIINLLRIKAEIKEHFLKLEIKDPYSNSDDDYPFITGPGSSILLKMLNAESRLDLRKVESPISISFPTLTKESESKALLEVTYKIEFTVTQSNGQPDITLTLRQNRRMGETFDYVKKMLEDGVLWGLLLQDGSALREQNAAMFRQFLERVKPPLSTTAAPKQLCRTALKDKALYTEQ